MLGKVTHRLGQAELGKRKRAILVVGGRIKPRGHLVSSASHFKKRGAALHGHRLTPWTLLPGRLGLER